MDNGLTLEERMALWDKARKVWIEYVAMKLAEEIAGRAQPAQATEHAA